MEDMERPDEATPEPTPPHEVRDRWLSALCYVGPGFLLSVFRSGKGAFLRWHIQQGFTLFFLEAVVLTLLVILENTIGRIPLLGFLLVIVVELAAFVLFLVLSSLGFVKALAGEEFRFPILDEYAERVPVHED